MTVNMVKNHRILKLVHPGGFVEIHQKPITADQVMKKNPRHFVTRPDVFKFPWIVVRPESVLNIGSVFYIVPFHTLHRLMRRKRCPFDNSPLLQQQLIDSSPVKVTFFHELFKNPCPNTSGPRSKVDFKIDHWPDDAIFPNCLIKDKHPGHDQDSPFRSPFQLELDFPRKAYSSFTSPFQLELDSPRKAFSVDHCYAAFECEDYQESKQQSDNNFIIEPTSSLDIASSDAHKGKTFPEVDDGLESNIYKKEKKVLKSCLKKEKNSRSQSFRVRFLIPEENAEKINIEVLRLQQTKSR